MDDFDVDYARAEVPPHLEPRNVRKVREHSSTLQLDLINPPRPGQRLLVLDLDYTLVDTSERDSTSIFLSLAILIRLSLYAEPLLDGSLPATETARPGLHEFLQEAYKEYDIAIWSQVRCQLLVEVHRLTVRPAMRQTSWRWLESKLTELGMIVSLLSSPLCCQSRLTRHRFQGEEDRRGYKISFVVDRRPMFTIFTSKNGQPYKHECVPFLPSALLPAVRG